MKRSSDIIFGLLVVISSVVSACSSVEKRDDFMEDYGYVCPAEGVNIDSKNLKAFRFDGKNCFKIKMEKDATKDFYIKKWEKDFIPELSDVESD